MDDKTKRNQIRKYFTYKGTGTRAAILLVVGFFMLLIGNASEEPIPLLLGVSVGVIGFFDLLGAIGRYFSVPSDDKIDTWLEEDVHEITKRALSKLDLDRVQLVNKEPLRAIGPVLWPRDAEVISVNDLLWRQGKDQYLRFAVYDIALIYTAEHLLAFYLCTYDTLKPKLQERIIKERTREFHYQDIVAITTSESSHKLKLPKGKEETFVIEEFSVSVSSGEVIDAAIDFPRLESDTKGSIHKNEVERTIQRLRNLLRDKKHPISAPTPAPVTYTYPSSEAAVMAGPSRLRASSPGGADAVLEHVEDDPTGTSYDHFCSTCGRTLAPDDAFCPGCGKKLKHH
jgi:hypothetical protein